MKRMAFAFAGLTLAALTACGSTLTDAPTASGGSVTTLVTNGSLDGDAHPYVGMYRFQRADGGFGRCTGTMLSPTVFLTAAHCARVAVSSWVTFNQPVNVAQFPTGFLHGVAYSAPLPSDLAVVVLDDPVELAEYGALPEPGFLDALATRRGLQSEWFTVVGYGLQSVKPELQADKIKYTGVVQLVSLASAQTGDLFVQTTSNPGVPHSGGSCLYDSGGPLFYTDSNVVVGTTADGNPNCTGRSFYFRTDTQLALNFLQSFLTRP